MDRTETQVTIDMAKSVMLREELSVYDVGTLLKGVAAMFQGYERAALTSVQYAKEDAESLVGFAKELIGKMERYQALLDEEVEKFNTAAQEAYEKAYKVRSSLIERMNSLPKLPDMSTRLPYGYDDIFKCVERFSHLNDEQWGKVIELAHALSGRPES
jgi:glutamine synthetase type III